MRWNNMQNFTGIFTFYQSKMTNLWPPFFMTSFFTKLPKYVAWKLSCNWFNYTTKPHYGAQNALCSLGRHHQCVSDVSMRQNSGDESSDWMLQWICCGSCHGAFALKSIQCKNRVKKNLHQLSWKAYVHVKCTPILVYLFLFCSFTIWYCLVALVRRRTALSLSLSLMYAVYFHP